MVDENRQKELEQVLHQLSDKIIAYTRKADSPDGIVGTLADPADLTKRMDIHVGETGRGITGLMESADLVLKESVVTWHRNFLEKLYASTNPVGIASDMLLSILNTNSHVYTASPALTVIERYVGTKYANMFGFNGKRAAGLTFPGGSYSNITAMHMARSLKYPETNDEGAFAGGRRFAIFTSADSHYSIVKGAILLGLGKNSVYKVPCNSRGEMDTGLLQETIEKAKNEGRTPLLINATAGSTVYGSFDDFEAISAIAKANDCWMHIDGSWGGNFIFSKKQSYKLKGSHLANSVTVNPHKMLGVPCTCSFLLVPDGKQFQTANSLSAPYLFHGSNDDSDENYDLADGTMGCGRRADSLKMYLAWQWYGTEGFGERIDNAVAVTQYLLERVKENPRLSLLSPDPSPCLQTSFYYSKNGKFDNAEENTKATRFIARQMLARSSYLVDYSLDAKQGEFFRVVLNAPTVSNDVVDGLIAEIDAVGALLE